MYDLQAQEDNLIKNYLRKEMIKILKLYRNALCNNAKQDYKDNLITQYKELEKTLYLLGGIKKELKKGMIK